MLRILLLAALGGLAFHVWTDYGPSESTASPDSRVGFTSVVMPKGAKQDTVLILAPENCPSDAAQRADALAARLTELGIPNRRSSRIALSIDNPGAEERAALKRTEAVLQSEIPAVFVNGMGKANPGIEEVVAVYRRTR